MGKGRGGAKCRICLGIFFPCCLLTGLVLIGVGVAAYLKFPDVVTSEIDKKVTVKKGHATYEQLENPSIPIYKDFYFFNLTNYVEFAESSGGAIPILEEKGPYSYSEYRTKTFTSDSNDDPDLISYQQKKIFQFNATTSGEGLAENDTICTINIPLVAAISQVKDSLVMRTALRALITTSGAKLYTCQKARALAWNYTDSFLKELHFAHQYPSKFVNLQVNNSINDSYISTIHTGVKDIAKIGEFEQWDGLKKLHTWPNGDLTGANYIRGTEGFFFRPNLKRGENLTAFVDDIQRSIDLVYQKEVHPLGLTGFRYGIDNKTFLSAFSEPQNARWGSWCPDGMFYLGPTQAKEIPVFGSKPHFLDGDPLLMDSVKGLRQNRTKHDTVIDVEPNTGANLNFARQLQINVQVNKTEKMSALEFPMHELNNIHGYKNSGVLYYPVVYIDERAMMDEEFKQYLENKGLKQVQIFNVAVPVLFAVLLFAGAVSLLVSMFTCAGFVSKSRKTDDDGSRTPLLNPST